MKKFVLCTMMMRLVRPSMAWVSPVVSRPASIQRIPRTFSSRRDLQVDDEGRRIRRQAPSDRDDFESSAPSGGGWDDFDPLNTSPSKPRSPPVSSGGGWDDFGPMDVPTLSPPNRNRKRNDNRRNDRRGNDRNNTRRFRGGRADKGPTDKKINLKALEGAGFVHLYGLSSCLNALKADRRDFFRPESVIDVDTLEGEDLEHELKQRERKPEAQFSPWLLIQERHSTRGGRNAEKAMAAQQVQELAKERGIPIATVDKGVLNTLSGNRPHQGYVLRCGPLSFVQTSSIPHPKDGAPNTWLVLDEVVDPQNLGALLRSAYFLGNVGVLVCSKNSAPPSPVVSAASAGALELLEVYSTSNLPRTLNKAREDGFRIVGASSSVPNDEDGASLYELQDLPKDNRPTLLVLGSEGSGLRTLVARACTDFVRIPGTASHDGVDSLNVSVTGGILLWHLLNQ